MTPEQIEGEYVTFPQIAAETGQTIHTVHNWANHQRHFVSKRIFGRHVVTRDEYARFKAAHPELFKQAAPT